MNDTKWIGPYKVSQLLNNLQDDEIRMPPHDPSVYVVTEAEWARKPDPEATILYVGSNTSDSALFRVRIGSLIADLFGFYSDERGHHSGGQSLHKYCLEVGLDPSDLYIGWKARVECARCAENNRYDRLQPRLNRARPARCKVHN